MERRKDAAGVMQRPQSWSRPACSVRLTGSILIDPDADKTRRRLPAESQVLPEFRTTQDQTQATLVGAQFVSFNFLNPLIWVVGSSFASTYDRLPAGKERGQRPRGA